MKTIKFLFWGFAILAMASCGNESSDSDKVQDDSAYALTASIGSSDPAFTAASDGGTVCFPAEGGKVVVDVDCGTDWTEVNYYSDLFGTEADMSSGTLTVTAWQNTSTSALSAEIFLTTAVSRVMFATLSITQDGYVAPEISVETASFHVPAVGATAVETAVDSSIGDWEVTETDDWLSAEKTSGGVRISIADNTETSERNGRVVLTASDAVHSAAAAVLITQEPKAYISADKYELSFHESGESAALAVESNFEWNYSYNTMNGWFSVTRSGDSLTVTATADNNGADRSDTITLTASDDSGDNSAELVVTVTEYGSQPDAMILTYTTTSTYKTVTLPVTGLVNCSVSWGDGTIEQVASEFPTHKYSSAGSFKVVIDGVVTAINSHGLDKTSTTPLLTGIEQWGDTGLTTMEYAFYNCSKLSSFPRTTGTPFSSVTSFEYAFYGCSAIETLPDDLFSSAGVVTTFHMAFRDCTGLKEIPSALFDGCERVTTFEQTFYGCKALTEVPDHLFDSCPNVETFKNCFQASSKIEGIPDELFAYNTKATSMYGIFYACPLLTEISPKLFENCTSVTDFSSAFGSSGLLEIPEGLFDNCNDATSFHGTFWGCDSLRVIPAGLFAGKSKVTDFGYVFNGCKSLKTIPDRLFQGCSAVTDFQYVFHQCSGLTEIPSGLFDDCPKVTTFFYAFKECTGLRSIPENLFAANPVVQSFMWTFYGSVGLTGESAYDIHDIDGRQVIVHLYERADYPELYPDLPSNYAGSNCYYGCSGLSDYSDIPLLWGGGGK